MKKTSLSNTLWGYSNKITGTARNILKIGMSLKEPLGFIVQLTPEWAQLPFDNFPGIWKKKTTVLSCQKIIWNTVHFCPVNMQNKSIITAAALFSKPGAGLKVLYHSLCRAHTCEEHSLMNKDVIKPQEPADSRAAPLTSHLVHVAQSLFLVSLLWDFTEYSELGRTRLVRTSKFTCREMNLVDRQRLWLENIWRFHFLSRDPSDDHKAQERNSCWKPCSTEAWMRNSSVDQGLMASNPDGVLKVSLSL